MAPRSTVVGLKVKPRVTELKYFPTALSLKVSGMRVASWLASVNSPITKSTMVSGARVSQKATELRFSLMVVDTKATGIRVNPSEKELKLTLMAQRKKGKWEGGTFIVLEDIQAGNTINQAILDATKPIDASKMGSTSAKQVTSTITKIGDPADVG